MRLSVFIVLFHVWSGHCLSSRWMPHVSTEKSFPPRSNRMLYPYTYNNDGYNINNTTTELEDEPEYVDEDSERLMLNRNNCNMEIQVKDVETRNVNIIVAGSRKRQVRPVKCEIVLRSGKQTALAVRIDQVNLNPQYEDLKIILRDFHFDYVLKEYDSNSVIYPLLLTETNAVYIVLQNNGSEVSSGFKLSAFTYKKQITPGFTPTTTRDTETVTPRSTTTSTATPDPATEVMTTKQTTTTTLFRTTPTTSQTTTTTEETLVFREQTPSSTTATPSSTTTVRPTVELEGEDDAEGEYEPRYHQNGYPIKYATKPTRPTFRLRTYVSTQRPRRGRNNSFLDTLSIFDVFNIFKYF